MTGAGDCARHPDHVNLPLVVALDIGDKTVGIARHPLGITDSPRAFGQRMQDEPARTIGVHLCSSEGSLRDLINVVQGLDNGSGPVH